MSRLAIFVLVAAVELGGAFGTAEAATVTLGETTMVVDLSVEVEVSADAVVAHLSAENDTQVISLLNRGGGVFGIRTELERRNWIVVFEILGPESHLSQPATLGLLGATLSVPSDTTTPPTPPDEDGLSEETRRWGLLGLALIAASLSVLAFWYWGWRGKDREEDPPGEEE